MNRFYKCLNEEKKYEMETLNYLDYDEFEFNDDNRYDIKIIKNDIETLVEVKSEKLASRTGNIAIEYFCRGKPSGIATTQAHYYYCYVIYSDRYRLFEIPVVDLKKMIKNKLYVRECIGGDDMASKMFLFSIKSIEHYEVEVLKD
jgi:tRNA U54 and U55 pseudouridine synthase Pus10